MMADTYGCAAHDKSERIMGSGIGLFSVCLFHAALNDERSMQWTPDRHLCWMREEREPGKFFASEGNG